jgi:hypothetical protein
MAQHFVILDVYVVIVGKLSIYVPTPRWVERSVVFESQCRGTVVISFAAGSVQFGHPDSQLMKLSESIVLASVSVLKEHSSLPEQRSIVSAIQFFYL